MNKKEKEDWNLTLTEEEEKEKDELRMYYSCSNYTYFLENHNRILDFFTPERILYHFSLSKLKYGDQIKFKNLSCCYLFIDNMYNVLYVGRTKNFYNRLIQHKKNNKKFLKLHSIIVVKTDNPQKEENLAIRHFYPEYNLRK